MKISTHLLPPHIKRSKYPEGVVTSKNKKLLKIDRANK